jgi:hypothetical protein
VKKFEYKSNSGILFSVNAQDLHSAEKELNAFKKKAHSLEYFDLVAITRIEEVKQPEQPDLFRGR